MFPRLLYISSYLCSTAVFACVATSSTTTPATTTTSATVTTTTLASTTTTAVPACDTCTQGQITFGTRSGIEIDVMGVFSTDPSTGCLSLVATCTADSGDWSYMQFNVDQGGPPQSSSATTTAALACINGNWVYTQDGISRIITRVTCNQSPIG